MTQAARRRSVAAIVVAVSAATLVAGCGNGGGGGPVVPEQPPVVTSAPPSVDGQVGAPDLPTVQSMGLDRSDPAEVIRVFCEIAFSRNSVTEEDFSTSLGRAADMMTKSLAGELIQPVDGLRPFPQWAQWQRENAWIRAVATETSDEHPPDTPTSMSRVMLVEQQPYRGDGTKLELVQSVAWVTVTKQADQWSVSQFTVSHDY